MRNVLRLGILSGLIGACWIFLASAGSAGSAEPSFVGILAFLDDPEVANQLGLSSEQRQKLTALLEARESEALELALQLRNLSPGERAEKLLPFRRESERQGLALLSPEQQKKLHQICLQRMGLASLAEEDVAAQIGLTEQQKTQVAQILRLREDRLAVTSKERIHIVRAETERQLADLLTPEQKNRWEALLAGAGALEAGKPSPTPSEPGGGTPHAPPATSTPPSSTPPSAPGPSGPASSKPESGSSEAQATPPPTEALPDSTKKPELPGGKPEMASSGPPRSEATQVAGGSQAGQTPKSPETSPPAEASPPSKPSPSAKDSPSADTASPAETSPPTKTSPPAETSPLAELPKPEMPAPSEKLSEGLARPEVPKSESVPSEPGYATPGTSAKEKPIFQAGSLPSPASPPATEATKLVPLDQVKLRFNFHYQPWKDVLEWFAQQAGLSLIMDDPPKGTFNYIDERAYSPAEAIDLLNGVLQTKGYVLVRRNRMLMVINLENGIPPLLIDTIPVEELDRRGTYEVVSVAFQLQKLAPEEIEGEIQKMLGAQGSVVSLPKSRQLLVTETVGRLRAIQRAIQRAEDPEGLHRQQQLRQIPLQHAGAQEVLPLVRQFLDIPPEQAAAPDGSIRILPDPTGKGLLVSGKEEKIQRLLEVLKFLDVPENAAKTGLDQTPQLEVYSVAPADPNSVLAVIQTLLAGSPDARVALDPKTGNLIALCKPSEHATIRATLQQMQTDPRKIEVIPLTKVDPQTAAASLKKLFGIGETLDPNKPQIEVDTMAKQLLVRATQSQLEQIKQVLEKMGETGEATVESTRGGNVRMVPITGRTAQDALERALEIWPTMYRNRIRVVRPSAVIPTLRPSSEEETPRRETGSSSHSSSPGSMPWDTPEELFEQLFGPLGGSRPSEDSPGGALRTRVIHPPTSPPSPPTALDPSGKPPFSPGLRPGGQPGNAPSGRGDWHPAGKPPVGDNSSMPGAVPPSSGSSPPGQEKRTPSETLPAPPPRASDEKTTGIPVFSCPIKPRVLLASYSAPAQPSEAESSSASPPKGLPSAIDRTTEPPSVVLPSDSGGKSSAAAPGEVPDAGKAVPSAKPADSSTSSAGGRRSEEPPMIVVAPGPGGIMIASEDLEALDAFENLLNTLASNLPESNVTVFYLKHAKAEAVADLLERIFGASSSSSGPSMGGGRGLLGDLAGAALGDAGGGILGTLLGLGGPSGGPSGGLAPTGTIQITPDPRLNALVVQANPKDTEMIEELLKILDQEKGPEPVAVQPKARVIPVVNTAAEDIAELIKEVYNDRLIGGGGGGQRPPTPQEFLQMLRGGGGGRRGAGGSSQTDIQQKMAIGVDSRNNALIVVAPDQLFQEVEQLVKQLDAAAAESNQTIRVVNLRNANPAAVQQALSALMGSNVQFGRAGTASRSRQQQPTPGQQAPSQGQPPSGMPNAHGMIPFWQFRGQGQFPMQPNFPFQGGSSSRQGRSSRPGR